MSTPQTLVALSTLVLVAGCASPGVMPVAAAKADRHAAHHPDGAASAPTVAMEDRMKAMRDMRDRMTKAKTPEERQVLMADHMKAMQDGMQMMKGMGGMGAMNAGAATSDSNSMPAGMAKCHQTMEARMEMMQTMMEMMMQRTSGQATAPTSK